MDCMNDLVDYRIDVIDWREGVLKLHRPDGTSENTIMMALSGPLHQQATAAVAAARASIAPPCGKSHHATKSYAMLASGPDAGTVVDIHTPGNIQRIDLCQCGARRVTYITASHRKQGGAWT